MKIVFSDMMKAFPTLVFNELAQYKKEKLRDGKEIIDLSIGSPDLPPPDFVRKELSTHVQKESNYGYTLTGTEELHEAIQQYYDRKYNVSVHKNKEITVTMGSQDGLVHLPFVLANPSDYVLVPDPGYTAYDAGIALAGATPYTMPLLEENNFLPDLDAIPEEVCINAKLMILNFPGNPVPAIATREFFERVVHFAKKYEIVVIHDFAYSELYYEEKPISFLSVKGAKEIGVEFNSLSKSFNMAGSRIGYVVGNEQVITGLAQLKSNLDYGVFLPVQKAAAKALMDGDKFSETLRNIYKERRNLFLFGLKKIGWEIGYPKASMFIWAKVPDGLDSKTFTYQLIDQCGIVVTPGIAFGKRGEGYVRISLTKDKEVLSRGLEKLSQSNFFSKK